MPVDRVLTSREWPPGETGRTWPSAASLTFVQGGQFQGDADDPNQVLSGDKGAEN